MSNDLIQVAPGLFFNKTFTCGARKSKTSYGKEDLVKFAKALNIQPVPSKNVDICHEVVKRLKEIHGSHAFAAPAKKQVGFSKDYDCDAKGKNALSAADIKVVAKGLGIKITGKNKKQLCQEIKKIKYGVSPAGAAAAASPSPVHLSKTYDCKSKGKNSISLDKFKKLAKTLNITKISGLNKEKLCEKIKQVKFAAAPPTPPKAPTPSKSPASSTSPLGYVHGSNFVKLGKNLVFNMDVDCDAKKTKSNPQNYNKDDLLKFAGKLGMKLKKTNGESCRAIKDKIKGLYKKPSQHQDSIKSLTPTPKTPLSDEELVEAIRKCLKLKN